MGSLKTYMLASFMLILSTIQIAGLAETILLKCPADDSSVPPLPCELKSETIFYGNDASRQTDILMDTSHIMHVLNNPAILQIKNHELTIAEGEGIVDNTYAAGFRKTWMIAITVEVDKHVRQGVFLRHTLTVKNVSYNDESQFRLTLNTDNLSFTTNDAYWFPTKSQESTVPDTPLKPATTYPVTSQMTTTTPGTVCDALSPQEFHDTINHQNEKNNISLTNLKAELLEKLKAELSKNTCMCGKCESTFTLQIICLIALLLLLLDSRPVNKYLYPKLCSLWNHYTQVQLDEDPRASPETTDSNQAAQSGSGTVQQNMGQPTLSDVHLPMTVEMQPVRLDQ